MIALLMTAWLSHAQALGGVHLGQAPPSWMDCEEQLCTAVARHEGDRGALLAELDEAGRVHLVSFLATWSRDLPRDVASRSDQVALVDDPMAEARAGLRRMEGELLARSWTLEGQWSGTEGEARTWRRGGEGRRFALWKGELLLQDQPIRVVRLVVQSEQVD